VIRRLTVALVVALAGVARAQSQEPLDIVFITAEVKPFSSTGGLANVSQELPATFNQLGHRAIVITPLWHNVDKSGLTDTGIAFKVDSEQVRLLKGTTSGVDVYFLDHPRYFSSARDGGIYVDLAGKDYRDYPGRYDFFSRASLEAVKALGVKPSVVHANDHHAGGVPWYAKQDRYFDGAVKVFEIHNAAYQGQFDAWRRGETKLPWPEAEFFGRVNPLKVGITSADLVMTVSPNYAKEIQDWRVGAGMEGLLSEAASQGRFIGILNGIDGGAWNPARDEHLWRRYSAGTLDRKAVNKARFQEQYFGRADAKVPLVVTVSRLAEQKGIEEIIHSVESVAKSGRPFRYVLLGTPDGVHSKKLEALAAKYPDRVAYDGAFSTAKEHRAYGAADLYLMPSRWEPSGLPQMYAMKYGAVPLVSRVGGLVDSVKDGRTGLTFGAEFPETYWGMPQATFQRLMREYEAARLEATKGGLERGLDLYGTPEYERVQRAGMRQEFRWTKVAGPQYVAAYRARMDRAGSAVKREAAGAGTFAAAYLLKEAMNGRVAFKDLAEPRFWGDLAAFSVAARVTEKLPLRGLARQALPLAAGMAAVQLLSGHASLRDIAIDTGAFLVAGAAVNLIADGLIYPALFAAGPPGWIAAGVYTVAKMAVTLYAGEKVGAWLRGMFTREAQGREGVVEKLNRIGE